MNLSWLEYGYDNDDNITSITDHVNSVNSMQYSYDSMDRLSQSIASSGSIKRLDFLFDTNGNRTSVEQRTNATDVSPIATDVYALAPGTNRLASITTAAGLRSISYDNRGNTSGETRPGGATVGTSYDGYGRLLSYARTGDPAQTNVYNGLDERVNVTNGSVNHTFVYDPDGRLVGEYGTSASDVIAETIWMTPEVSEPGLLMGGDDGVGGYAPLAVATGSGASAALYWVYGNHLGVPAVTTDASGAVATPAAYTMAGFPGQTRTLSDIYYNRYRDYDASLGRYVQADPVGLVGGDNPYQYAIGNPLSWTDPLGLQKIVLFNPQIPNNQRYFNASINDPDRPGYCVVYGHMAETVIIGWLNGRPIYVRSTDALHALVLKGGCKPHEPLILVGCNSGAGDDSLAEKYAKDYQVTTWGTDSSMWVTDRGFIGLYQTRDEGNGKPGPDYQRPGHWRRFKP